MPRRKGGCIPVILKDGGAGGDVALVVEGEPRGDDNEDVAERNDLCKEEASEDEKERAISTEKRVYWQPN